MLKILLLAGEQDLAQTLVNVQFRRSYNLTFSNLQFILEVSVYKDVIKIEFNSRTMEDSEVIIAHSSRILQNNCQCP